MRSPGEDVVATVGTGPVLSGFGLAPAPSSPFRVQGDPCHPGPYVFLDRRVEIQL